MNFIIFIASYFVIILSNIDYGLIFNTFFHTDKKVINFGLNSKIGIYLGKYCYFK